VATFSTVITDHQNYGDQKIWTVAGHTALDPYLVIQKRRSPSNPSSNLEDTLSVVKQTEDVGGVVLPARILFEAKVKRPKLGQSADVTAALAVFRDFVASDEFGAIVTSQAWVK
jgi:hypothetical protein